MKQLSRVILSVMLAVGLAGCAVAPRPAQAPSELAAEQPPASVYGVEAPNVEEDVFAQAEPRAATQTLSATNTSEMRGVWLAYVNYESWIKNNTEAEFTANMRKIFKNVADQGMNTVFFQVRPFGDAMYESNYFPWSRYLTGTEGVNPGYDPLEIVCNIAPEYGLRIEAWINPYRVRTDDTEMSADNQAYKWQKSKSRAVVSWNGGLYYNPASAEARKLITNGVTEIVRNYNVYGIHFDDYFYPTTDMKFDSADYKASGSKLSQADWRRENVNKLVRQVYAAVKSADPNCVFGISPQGNMQINYDSQFIDVEKWLSNSGYIDYICPQIYFGYKNKTVPYAQAVKDWNALIKNDVKLYIGLGAYKVGAVDKWAGEDGQNEWVGTKDILARMTKTARAADNYGGVVIYSYDSIFKNNSKQMQNERASLRKLFS